MQPQPLPFSDTVHVCILWTWKNHFMKKRTQADRWINKGVNIDETKKEGGRDGGSLFSSSRKRLSYTRLLHRQTHGAVSVSAPCPACSRGVTGRSQRSPGWTVINPTRDKQTNLILQQRQRRLLRIQTEIRHCVFLHNCFFVFICFAGARETQWLLL